MKIMGTEADMAAAADGRWHTAEVVDATVAVVAPVEALEGVAITQTGANAAMTAVADLVPVATSLLLAAEAAGTVSNRTAAVVAAVEVVGTVSNPTAGVVAEAMRESVAAATVAPVVAVVAGMATALASTGAAVHFRVAVVVVVAAAMCAVRAIPSRSTWLRLRLSSRSERCSGVSTTLRPLTGCVIG